MTATCRVVVLTYNCEGVIQETLTMARRLDPRPLVVDSYSTDATLQRVGHEAEVVQRAFSNYGDQRNWAIAHLQTGSAQGASPDWQLHLDADEVLDDEAVAAIQRVLQAGDAAPHRAYLLRRIDYFMGRRLRHSGLNPWHLRLFRTGEGACEQRLYDQHFVSSQPAGRLAGCMHDKNAVSLNDWTSRHNRWSELEVAEMRGRHGDGAAGTALQPRLAGDARERTRWLKAVYYRLPSGLRAVAYFAYRYVFRLGFLDGREGLYFAFLQGLWFRMLVDAKMHEARQAERR
jgi:glycosyltransferase involved in cell wall biosynthesis